MPDANQTQYLIEIHEKVAKIEVVLSTLAESIKEHRTESQAGNKVLWGEVDDLRDDLSGIKTDIAEAKGAIAGMKWVGGAVAALIAMLVKLLPLPWK